jgi:hypothetical protein
MQVMQKTGERKSGISTECRFFGLWQAIDAEKIQRD